VIVSGRKGPVYARKKRKVSLKKKKEFRSTRERRGDRLIQSRRGKGKKETLNCRSASTRTERYSFLGEGGKGGRWGIKNDECHPLPLRKTETPDFTPAGKGGGRESQHLNLAYNCGGEIIRKNYFHQREGKGKE